MARGPSILIVDNDPGIRCLVRRGLKKAGYRVQDIEPGPHVLGLIAEHKFDLAILDIDHPAGCGSEAIRLVRELSPMPIVVSSVCGDEDATVEALDSGADDYIRKPFRIKELFARINNALRRRAREQGKQVHLVTGDLEIDLLHRRIRSSGDEVHLPAKQYEVLRVLTEDAGKVLTHDAILRAVWGANCTHRVTYLRVAIRELRRKLEADPARPRHILTERRVGYRLGVQAHPSILGGNTKDRHRDSIRDG
jgi:two-component system, OmpR family, KDP operon response regulator KdpE